jgi:hypothetical protein
VNEEQHLSTTARSQGELGIQHPNETLFTIEIAGLRGDKF